MPNYLFISDSFISGVKSVEDNDLVLVGSTEIKLVIKNGVDLVKGLNQLTEKGFSIILYSLRIKKNQIRILESLAIACTNNVIAFPFSSLPVIGAYDETLPNVSSNHPTFTQEGAITIASWGAPNENNKASLLQVFESVLKIKPEDRGDHYVIDMDAGNAKEEGYNVFYHHPNLENQDIIESIQSILATSELTTSSENDSLESDKNQSFSEIPLSSDTSEATVTHWDLAAFEKAESDLASKLNDRSIGFIPNSIRNSGRLVLKAVVAEVKNWELSYSQKTTVDAEQLNTLTEVLKLTYALTRGYQLESDINNHLEYEKLIDKVSGQRSGGKILAGVMIVFLSLVVLGLAVTAAVASFGTVPALMSITLLFGGAGAASQGISISVATLAFFGVFAGASLAYSGREKGVAAATHHFFNEVTHLPPENEWSPSRVLEDNMNCQDSTIKL